MNVLTKIIAFGLFLNVLPIAAANDATVNITNTSNQKVSIMFLKQKQCCWRFTELTLTVDLNEGEAKDLNIVPGTYALAKVENRTNILFDFDINFLANESYTMIISQNENSKLAITGKRNTKIATI